MIQQRIRAVLYAVIVPVILVVSISTACDDIRAPAEECVSCNTGSDTGAGDNSSDDGAVPEPVNSYIGVVDENFFVQQDDSLCGPASFYMIFKYYGDPCSGAVLSINPECAANAIISGIDEIFSVILSSSWITSWLDSFLDGVDCKNFFEKITSLSRCIEGEGVPFYSVVDGSCNLTGEAPDDYEAEENIERRNRFEYILENFLKNGYPVILHLRRTYDDYPLLWYPGHYVVLMGYDTDTQEVYIMDPFQEFGDHAAMTVPHDSFIMQRWYEGAGITSKIYPAARWDGTWIGFHH